MMQYDLDRAGQPFPAEIGANFRLEIRRVPMRTQETGKVLQSEQRLVWRAHEAEMQPETVETGRPAPIPPGRAQR